MNKWILEERRLSVLDLLHSLWSKCMDLRFRRLQEAQKYHDSGAMLTKYSSKLLQESMTLWNIRLSDKFVMRMLTMHRYTHSPAIGIKRILFSVSVPMGDFNTTIFRAAMP